MVFTWSTIAASVAVLPEPARPETSTRPCCWSASAATALGNDKRFETWDAGQHPAQHEAHPTALAERAHAEAAESRDAVHEVGLVRGLELTRTRVGHDRQGAHFDLGRFDRVEGCLAEPAVNSQARPRTNLHVHVRGALLDGET